MTLSTADTYYFNLNGGKIMIQKTTNENGDSIYEVDTDSNITLATANTYVDKNIIINIPLNTKADIESPTFTGTPTIDGEEVATKKDINESDLKGEKGDKPVITAEVESVTDEDGTPGVHTSFYADEEDLADFTIMNGHKGERGISLLHVSTSPWANIHKTPDGLTHTMAMNEDEIKTEAKIDKLYLGDIIEWDGFIYQVAYLGDP